MVLKVYGAGNSDFYVNSGEVLRGGVKFVQEFALAPFYSAGMIDSRRISGLLLKSTGRVRCEFQRY